MRTIAIIGGGASGIMAALTASENQDHHILLFEKEERIGRKLLSTGNGRCNLSNLRAETAHYHGDHPEFILPALKNFDPQATLAYFRSLGLWAKSESDGRIYPNSNQAAGVLDMLRFALERDNISLFSNCRVSSVRKKGAQFLIHTDTGVFHADRLIIACGGCAAPKLGGCNDGYTLLRSFGHRITPLSPALTQLKTDLTPIRGLKGIKADAEITLHCANHLCGRSYGEVLFTDYGISGPAIFNLSRCLRGYEDRKTTLCCNFLPGMEEQALRAMLDLPRRTTCENLLTGILSKRLGQAVVKYAGISLSREIISLTDAEKNAVIRALKCFTLEVRGTTGFANAQVTAGGADTAEFCPNTLESKLIPGLYACGEVLDIDGDCGGFNLQWAWSSGRLAGSLL